MNKALIKANNELISFCKCTDPVFATSGQADCPWCGCGWLFSCIDCGKAFVFAKVVHTDLSSIELAQKDLLRLLGEKLPANDENVLGMAEWFDDQLKDIPLETICVIVDGKILPISTTNTQYEGWFAKHNFDVPPQVAANGNRELIMQSLGNVDYWLDRELPDNQKM